MGPPAEKRDYPLVVHLPARRVLASHAPSDVIGRRRRGLGMPTSHWRAPPSARSSPAWRVALSLILLLSAASPAAARFPRRRISRRLVSTDTVGAVNATATASPPGKPHQEPSPLQGPPGTTDEDCRKHPGLCQPMACELWRDDIKDRRARRLNPQDRAVMTPSERSAVLMLTGLPSAYDQTELDHLHPRPSRVVAPTCSRRTAAVIAPTRTAGAGM